jgi:hypothetical protein
VLGKANNSASEYEVDLSNGGNPGGAVSNHSVFASAVAVNTGARVLEILASSPTDNTLSVFLGAGANPANTVNATSSPVTVSDPLIIGGQAVISAALIQPFTGTIAEVLIYGRVLPPAERLEMATYLKAKWGI